MMTKALFQEWAREALPHCTAPAARHKILARYLELPEQDAERKRAQQAFRHSDVVAQLEAEQDNDGGWGPLSDKDYHTKSIFPTTFVALERCLYLGLAPDDGPVMPAALEHLERYLSGDPPRPLYNKNERAVPELTARIAGFAERIQPNHPLVDAVWGMWAAIAAFAFADGSYSHERDMLFQHDALGTREKRLVPLPTSLLLTRRDGLPDGLEEATANHYGRHAFENGYFWDKNLLSFPESFQTKYTRRWFHTIHYINRFYGAQQYLNAATRWLMDSRDPGGFWDYGPQVNDPWGYFCNFAAKRRTPVTRICDCTMEVLDILHTTLCHSPEAP